MFLARRPTDSEIDRFLHDSRDRRLSYAPIGIAQSRRPWRNFDELAVTIGHGDADFERARAALLDWCHFDLGWVDIFPRRAPVAAGTAVAVLIRHLGFWSLNGCRVLYTIGGVDGATRFGFAYGTLTNHAESGEEIFEVLIDPRTGNVVYRIRAASRPRAMLAWLGYPIVRVLQRRFRHHSAAAMTRAMRGVSLAP
jgi:uncharacterized protein (UPF0548 family)